MPVRMRIAFIAGVLAALAGAWLARPPALTAPDQQQPRLDAAAPLPRPGQPLEQTFIPTRNGLAAVEVLAVVYPAEDGSAQLAKLTLTLADADGPVAARTFAALAHNAPARLVFDPQPASRGRVYTLTLSGPADALATAWAYSLDGYAPGGLWHAGLPQPGDLRFTTTYTYLGADAVRDLWAALGPLARLALAVWLLLFAPGLLTLGVAPGLAARLSPTERMGLAPGLSAALLALAWLWVGVAGGRWSPLGLGVVAALGGLVLALRWLRRLARPGLRPRPRGGWAQTLLPLLVVSVGLIPRLLAIRDLVLPQWVDGPHHYTIARLLAESGHVPAGYAPVLPIESFSYHFGYHALAVSAHWLSGLSLPDTMLWLGQALQGLVPLSAYAAVSLLTRRPRAGLLAALFLAGLSYFPGYYVTWGRYTQLAGLLLLFPAMAYAPVLLSRPSRRGWRSRAAVLLAVALLSAGLFLTHYPLFVLWLSWVAARLLMEAASRLRGRALAELRAYLLGWVAVGAGALALAAPWLWRLASRLAGRLAANPALLAAPAGFNEFPFDYFSSSLERAWLLAALAALLAGLLMRDRLVWLVLAWCALAGAVVNVGSGNWLVTNNTLATVVFVPGAILLGWGGDAWLSLPERCLWPLPDFNFATLRAVARLSLGALIVGVFGLVLGYGAVRGLAAQAGLINPVTTLALPADVEALDWAEAHLPADAVVAINSWEWLNGTWAGSDGGAWLWPITGRRTTLPPADYAYGSSELQTLVNADNRRLSEAASLSPPERLAVLREAGVTHVFIGARGGMFQPEWFAGSPDYRLVYTNGATWLFAVSAPP